MRFTECRVGVLLFILLLPLTASLVDAESRFENTKRLGSDAPTQPETALQITVELRDGSRLVGTPSILSLSLRTSFAKLDLPLKLIESVEIVDENKTAKVHCTNGDIVQGTLLADAITINTAFDRVAVPVKSIVRIAASAGGAHGLPSGLRRGLLVFYSFDKNEESVATDQGASGRDGKVHGAKWTSDGAVGGALKFDGDESYVEIPARDFPTGSEPRSLAAWVFQDSIKQRYYVVGYGGLNTGEEFRISVNEFEPGQFSLETRFGGWHSKASLANNRWYHLAVTWRGDAPPKFYVNGSESAVAGTWLSPAVRTTSEWGRIGTGGSYGGYFFKGKIDEVGLWNRALTSSEVQTLYRQRVSGLK